MAGHFPARFTPDTKNDSCGYTVAREVTVKNSRAFPTDWLEVKYIGGEQQVDSACETFLHGRIIRTARPRFASSHDR